MYNWVLSALVVAVVIHSIDCVCDSSPDCQSLRFREGLSTGAPCCQCRNVRGFRCRRGERFVPIQGLGRCCSDPSRVIRWNEGFIPTSRVSESNTVYFTPRIEREFLVPRRDTLQSRRLYKRRNPFSGRSFPTPHKGGVDETQLRNEISDTPFVRREPAFGPSFRFVGGRNALQVRSPTASSTPSFIPFIIGGEDVIPSGDNGNGMRHVPWQAGIRRVKSGLTDTEHHCGGTIINTQWILTAAHCFWNSSGLIINATDLRVRVGDLNNRVKEPDEQEFQVRTILRHPSFRVGLRGDFDYDVALILIQPVNGRFIQYNPNVQRAYLPSRNLQIIPRSECYSSGWGRTTTDLWQFGVSDVLQVARTDVLDQAGQATCNTAFQDLITQRMICAGYLDGTPIDTCKGDSGGPLVCKVRIGGTEHDVVVGVTSWGSRNCAERGYPGVYANVQELMDWIYSIMRNHKNVLRE